MSLNDFSVEVISNDKIAKKDDNGYVYLNDGNEYNINLINGQKFRDN